MSPIRINRPGGQRKPVTVKPVTLPTFSFYGFEPVVYAGGRLEWGRRLIPLRGRK